MKSKITLSIVIIITVGLSLYIYYRFVGFGKVLEPGTVQHVRSSLQSSEFPNIPGSNEDQVNQTQVPFTVEPVAENLSIPWSIVFTSPNRIIFTERTGAIRQIVNDQLQEEPLITFEEVSTQAEEGLMGLAIDPNYQDNRYIYILLLPILLKKA